MTWILDEDSEVTVTCVITLYVSQVFNRTFLFQVLLRHDSLPSRVYNQLEVHDCHKIGWDSPSHWYNCVAQA